MWSGADFKEVETEAQRGGRIDPGITQIRARARLKKLQLP